MGGSSPLARGLPPATSSSPAPRRIIPARAGFTAALNSSVVISPDHPRSRGVYNTDLLREIRDLGSSPLARGLLHDTTDGGPDAGIIPARAGFTRPTGPGRPTKPDHPRSRGVYSANSVEEEVDTGSSPLARGLRIPPEQQVSGDRIIPARAGFTWRTHPTSSRQRDHPRSRGVYPSSAESASHPGGSSPLARGLRSSPTPTPMGTWDHPRSRGVYSVMVPRLPPPAGSSPLARGLRRRTYPPPRPRCGSSPLARGLRF